MNPCGKISIIKEIVGLKYNINNNGKMNNINRKHMCDDVIFLVLYLYISWYIVTFQFKPG